MAEAYNFVYHKHRETLCAYGRQNFWLINYSFSAALSSKIIWIMAWGQC